MFLDIAIGILTAIGISEFFDMPLNALFVAGGILFALLPDIDYLFFCIRDGNQKYAHQHRDLIHYPLFYIPLGMIAASLVNVHWGLLFGITSLLHFQHDSIGIGWGIKWLWPFSQKSFKLFSRKDGQLSWSWRHYAAWTPQELKIVAETHGDPNWFRNIYLRWHPYAIVEFLAFLIALIVLLFHQSQ